jgi:hypothetical protein
MAIHFLTDSFCCILELRGIPGVKARADVYAKACIFEKRRHTRVGVSF